MGTYDVAIVMGSVSDYAVMSGAVETLGAFAVSHKVHVVSAHRTPARLFGFANDAIDNFKIIIAGAGGAAHLPGMIASMTTLPVLGVPIAIDVGMGGAVCGSLGGMDSLLSIVQMPKGVPVGTVAIGASVNAAILAIQILALNDERLRNALIQYKKDAEQSVPYTPNDHDDRLLSHK